MKSRSQIEANQTKMAKIFGHTTEAIVYRRQAGKRETNAYTNGHRVALGVISSGEKV